MIKVIEKDYLEDNFINKVFLENICIKDKIIFNTSDTYYFGNYKEDKINVIKNKLLKNKKSLIKAINNGSKIIIYGNSFDLFNNNFKKDNLNIFTAYNKNIFRKRKHKLYIKNKNKSKFKIIENLENGIDTLNFKYKNMICIQKKGKV